MIALAGVAHCTASDRRLSHGSGSLDCYDSESPSTVGKTRTCCASLCLWYLRLLADAQARGVHLYSANVITMDYDRSYARTNTMAQIAIASALKAREQCHAIDPSMRIGLTPMIGVNDEPGETFTLADAFLMPQLHYATFTPEGTEALATAPAAAAWLDRMRARRSVAATNPLGGG